MLSLVLVGLAGLVLVVEADRHHAASEAALLLAGLMATGFIARWRARDLRAHPANFPAPAPSNGLRMTAPTEVAGGRSRWASPNHTKHL